jgi:hypothetical protein
MSSIINRIKIRIEKEHPTKSIEKSIGPITIITVMETAFTGDYLSLNTGVIIR